MQLLHSSPGVICYKRHLLHKRYLSIEGNILEATSAYNISHGVIQETQNKFYLLYLYNPKQL
jgi:hypothetical protein